MIGPAHSVATLIAWCEVLVILESFLALGTKIPASESKGNKTNMHTNTVRNDTTKEVGWSYPTSDNAKQFGFYKTGCWTVSLAFTMFPPKAVKAFASESDATVFAESLPHEWSTHTCAIIPTPANPQLLHCYARTTL